MGTARHNALEKERERIEGERERRGLRGTLMGRGSCCQIKVEGGRRAPGCSDICFFMFFFLFKSAVWLDVDVPRRLPQVSDRPSLPLSPKWIVMTKEA